MMISSSFGSVILTFCHGAVEKTEKKKGSFAQDIVHYNGIMLKKVSWRDLRRNGWRTAKKNAMRKIYGRGQRGADKSSSRDQIFELESNG